MSRNPRPSQTVASGSAFGAQDEESPLDGMHTGIPPFSTTVARPFALIRRGGIGAAGLSFTRFALLTEAIESVGGHLVYRGYIGATDLTGWSQHPRRIEGRLIIRRWDQMPTPGAIRAEIALFHARERETA